MWKNKFSLALTQITIIALTINLITSCNIPSKGDVRSQFGSSLKLGATKTDVLKYIDALEINGTKADRSGYIKNTMSRKVSINGEDTTYDASVDISFRGQGSFYCGAFANLYFDQSERLLHYFVEDIYC